MLSYRPGLSQSGSFGARESLRLRQTESRLNPRLCYFCIKGVAGIIIDTEVYVQHRLDFFYTENSYTRQS